VPGFAGTVASPLPTSTIHNWDTLVGRHDFVASAAPSSLPPDTVHHALGRVDYDLSPLELTDDDVVALDIQVSVGRLTVLVPEDADVVVNSTVSVGNHEVLGQIASGVSQHRDVVDHGPDGPGGGQIQLDLDVSVGSVAVERVATANVFEDANVFDDDADAAESELEGSR
jgi:hypothetical protein